MTFPRVRIASRSIYHTFNRCVDIGAWMDTDYKKPKNGLKRSLNH